VAFWILFGGGLVLIASSAVLRPERAAPGYGLDIGMERRAGWSRLLFYVGLVLAVAALVLRMWAV